MPWLRRRPIKALKKTLIRPQVAQVAGFILTLCLALESGWGAEANNPSRDDIVELNAAIAAIESWLQQANQAQPEHEQRLRETEQEIGRLESQIDTTEASIATVESELTNLEQQAEDLKHQRARQESLLGPLLKAAYLEGPSSYLKLLLNQEDPTRSSRMLYYYRIINQQRRDAIADYQRLETELEETEVALQGSRTDLLEHKTELVQQANQLETAYETRQLTLTELAAAIALRSSELEELQADRLALEDLLTTVEQATADLPQASAGVSFNRQQGSLPWPGEGLLLNRFGDSYGDGNLQRQGISIATRAGSPVQAVHDGRVVFADWLRGSGQLLIIDHGDGYMSLYGHNETLLQNQGDAVAGGDIIARAGNSGGQDQTTVYFEIRRNGRPVDPLQWLRPRQ